MRFLPDLAKLAVAWPLYATYYAIVLANARQGYGAKVATFLTFLPALVVTSAVWAMLWAFILWLVMRD
jgi:phosphotransferase system  glucose/maltose/N-acetylglucosamine-specific IIC component